MPNILILNSGIISGMVQLNINCCGLCKYCHYQLTLHLGPRALAQTFLETRSLLDITVVIHPRIKRLAVILNESFINEMVQNKYYCHCHDMRQAAGGSPSWTAVHLMMLDITPSPGLL